MPAPDHLAMRVVFRRRAKAAADPHLRRTAAISDHQSTHFMSPRPTAIVGIHERDTRRWRGERRAIFRGDEGEQFLCPPQRETLVIKDRVAAEPAKEPIPEPLIGEKKPVLDPF